MRTHLPALIGVSILALTGCNPGQEATTSGMAKIGRAHV